VSIKQRLSNVYYGWVIVAVLSVANFTQVGEFNPVLAIFIRPFGEEFGWSRAEVSLGITLGSIGGGLIGPVMGPLIDRYGSRAVLLVFQIIFGTCLLSLTFLDGALIHFLVAYSVGRMVVQGGTQLATQVAVANWFTKRRGRAMGLTIIGTRGGQAILPAIVATIIETSGWRWGWAFLGSLVWIFAIVPCLVFVRRRPEDMGLLPDGAQAVPAAAHPAHAAPAVAAPHAEDSWTLREAARTRSLWLLGVASSFTYFVGAGVNLHLYPYLTDRGLTPPDAILAASSFFSVAAVGAVVWGAFLDRIPLRFALGAVLAIAGLSMGLLMMTDNLLTALAFAVLYGMAFGGTQTIISVMWATYFGRGHVGAISGAMLPMQLFTNAMGPLFAGWSYDTTNSYFLAFTVFGATSLIGAVCAFFAGAPRLRRVPPPRIARTASPPR
jgi:MFS family permease